MKKFKMGDYVVSTITIGALKQGELYRVIATCLIDGLEVEKNGQTIYTKEKYTEHATKLHKFLAGDDNV